MHREELKNSDFKQTQLASLQVELGKANSNKASFRQIDLNLRATLHDRFDRKVKRINHYTLGRVSTLQFPYLTKTVSSIL